MVYLLLAILCSTSIYIVFKVIAQVNANLKACLVLNYLIASLAGMATQGKSLNARLLLSPPDWIWLSAIIGFLFVVMFYLIGISSQKVGITPTSLATRLSVIIPFFVSMFYFNETRSPSKYLAIAIALVAVVLASYQKSSKQGSFFLLILPFVLFFGSGSVDSLIKFSQHFYIPPAETASFSGMVFSFALITAIAFYFFTQTDRHFFLWKNILLGSLLGMVNFGALYFMMFALHTSGIESSFLFGINNLAIITLSVVSGILFFREKPKSINLIGLGLAFVAIMVMMLNNQWN